MFKFDPVLDYHFELLVKETVTESVSARVVLHEVVFVSVVLFDGSVERNSNPA